MVWHVGIDSFGEIVSVYETESKRQSAISIRALEFDDDGYIDKLFKSIKAQIPGDLGCCCICLHFDYGEEIKNQLILSGTNYGFSKVEIIDERIVIGWYGLAQSGYKPKENDNIWIINNTKFYKWTKIEGKLKLLIEVECVGVLTETKLNKMKKDYGNPAIIVYFNPDKLFRMILKKQFPQCFLFFVNYSIFLADRHYYEWALKEALIMAGGNIGSEDGKPILSEREKLLLNQPSEKIAPDFDVITKEDIF